MSNSSRPAAPRAGVDQRARIDVAPREHAVEGRVDFLESFKLFEAAHVGVGGGQVCLSLLVSAGLLVGFLSGDGVGLAQVLPAVGADFRQSPSARQFADARPASGSIPDRPREYRSSPATRLSLRGCQYLCTSAPGSRWCGRRLETPRRPAESLAGLSLRRVFPTRDLLRRRWARSRAPFPWPERARDSSGRTW